MNDMAHCNFFPIHSSHGSGRGDSTIVDLPERNSFNLVYDSFIVRSLLSKVLKAIRPSRAVKDPKG